MLDAGEDVTFAPGRTAEKPVDVALLTVRRDLHDRLRPIAAGIGRVPEDDAVDQQDVVFMCGFPTFMSFRESNTRHVATISLVTGVTGRDEHGRLEVDWEEAVPYEGTPKLPHLDFRPGEVGYLGHPAGISGGGLWRVHGTKEGDLIWSPSSHADLIGVPVAFVRPRTQYAESVAAWGTWLRESAERLA